MKKSHRSSEGRNSGGRYITAVSESSLEETTGILIRWEIKLVADGWQRKRQRRQTEEVAELERSLAAGKLVET